MIEAPILVALAMVAVSAVACGGALLVAGRARLAAALLVLSGLGAMTGTVLTTNGRSDAAAIVLTAAAALLLPLALTAYPTLHWRHPVDLVAIATLAGCGAASCLLWNNEAVLGWLGVSIAVTLFAHTWWRVETSRDRERQALLWMALSLGTCALLGGLLTFASGGAVGGALSLGLFALVGPALYVGGTAPEVVDVRGLVVTAVVLAVVTITYVALFVALASFLELAAGRTPSTGSLALVGALVALTFAPLQIILRGVVDGLLFGTRPHPLDAANQVAGRIGDDPVLALRAIREALVLPYAELRVDGAQLAASGTATTHTRTFALDGLAGELVVGLRPGDLALSRDDQHVLRLTVPLLDQMLRARALAADLLDARGQLITALEEERRRLRRDLHDGLGPRLSGIAFQSDAARNLLHTDPGAADELLRDLRAETVTAIQDIRRLVYAMRPPALDELGLVPALRQQAAALRTSTGTPLAVTVTAPEGLLPLPATVEVAAYRIVLEALTNVARHSRSATAAVALRVTPSGLAVEITDSGRTTMAWPAGVGLSSMRERAAELGGTLVAGPGTGPVGGRVEALLPMGPPDR